MTEVRRNDGIKRQVPQAQHQDWFQGLASIRRLGEWKQSHMALAGYAETNINSVYDLAQLRQNG